MTFGTPLKETWHVYSHSIWCSVKKKLHLPQESLATAIRVSLPPPVLAVFAEESYKGGALLVLPQSGALQYPTAYEVSLNYSWLLPIVRMWPSKAMVIKNVMGKLSWQVLWIVNKTNVLKIIYRFLIVNRKDNSKKGRCFGNKILCVCLKVNHQDTTQ